MTISRRKLWRLMALPTILTGRARAQVAPKAAAGRAGLNDMINGLRWSQMVSVVARLGIADQLQAGTKTVKQLAEETKSHEDSLYRVLRALASRGVFEELEGKRFRLTAGAEALRSDVPGSLRLTAQVMLGRSDSSKVIERIQQHDETSLRPLPRIVRDGERDDSLLTWQ